MKTMKTNSNYIVIAATVLTGALILTLLNFKSQNVVHHNKLVESDTDLSLQNDIQQFNRIKSEFEQFVLNSKVELETLRQEITSSQSALLKDVQSAKNNPQNKNDTLNDTPPTSTQLKINQTEMQQRLEQEANQSFITVDNSLLSETIDSEWSSYAISEITTKFEATELSNIEIVELDCRTTLCKMNINIASPDSQMDTFDKLNESLPWDGETLIQINADGSNAVIYLSRENHRLTPNTVHQNSDDQRNSIEPG